MKANEARSEYYKEKFKNIDLAYLNQKEINVLEMCMSGISTAQIAETLGCERNQISSTLQTITSSQTVKKRFDKTYEFLRNLTLQEETYLCKGLSDKGVEFVKLLRHGNYRHMHDIREATSIQNEEYTLIQKRLSYLKRKTAKNDPGRYQVYIPENEIPSDHYPAAKCAGMLYINRKGSVYARQKNGLFMHTAPLQCSRGLQVQYYDREGSVKSCLLHVLMAETFLNADKSSIIKFSDGNKFNVDLSNIYLESAGTFLLKCRGINREEVDLPEDSKFMKKYGVFVSRDGRIFRKSPLGAYTEVKTFVTNGNRMFSTGHNIYRVKRIVAEAFLPNPGNCKYICCKDGDNDNLSADNLVYIKKLHSIPKGDAVDYGC